MNKQQQRRRHNRSGGARSCYASRVTREVLARIFIRAISSVPHRGHPLPFASRDVGEVRWPPDMGRGRPPTRAQHHETKRRNNQREPHITDLWTKERRGPKTPPPSSRNQPVKDLADPRDHHNLQQKNCRNSQCPCYASRVVREVLARIFIRAISSVPHRDTPFPSPHVTWTKFGGHPSREGNGPTQERNTTKLSGQVTRQWPSMRK